MRKEIKRYNYIPRKSIMEILHPFEGKKVLDLFAGVGTLGIESISRGAKSVVFVENNFKAIKVLKKNIDILDMRDNFSIINSDVIRYLKFDDEKFDLIFA